MRRSALRLADAEEGSQAAYASLVQHDAKNKRISFALPPNRRSARLSTFRKHEKAPDPQSGAVILPDLCGLG
jgi:S1-C subfamily serine protease